MKRYYLCFPVALAVLASQALAVQEPAKTISLTIDYGDGVEKRFTALPWRDEMTVEAALRAAEKHPRGIRCEIRGSGTTAFLVKLDDIKNEGGTGRGWIYRVNGKLADRGIGAQVLRPGDAILWKFEKFQ